MPLFLGSKAQRSSVRLLSDGLRVRIPLGPLSAGERLLLWGSRHRTHPPWARSSTAERSHRKRRVAGSIPAGPSTSRVASSRRTPSIASNAPGGALGFSPRAGRVRFPLGARCLLSRVPVANGQAVGLSARPWRVRLPPGTQSASRQWAGRASLPSNLDFEPVEARASSRSTPLVRWRERSDSPQV